MKSFGNTTTLCKLNIISSSHVDEKICFHSYFLWIHSQQVFLKLFNKKESFKIEFSS